MHVPRDGFEGAPPLRRTSRGLRGPGWRRSALPPAPAVCPAGPGPPEVGRRPHLNCAITCAPPPCPRTGRGSAESIAGRVSHSSLGTAQPLELWMVRGPGDVFAVLPDPHSRVDGISGVRHLVSLSNLDGARRSHRGRDRWLRARSRARPSCGRGAVELATVPGELTARLRAIVRGPRRPWRARATRRVGVGRDWPGAGPTRRREPLKTDRSPAPPLPGSSQTNDVKSIKDESAGTVNEVGLAKWPGAWGRSAPAGPNTDGLELKAWCREMAGEPSSAGRPRQQVGPMMGPAGRLWLPGQR